MFFSITKTGIIIIKAAQMQQKIVLMINVFLKAMLFVQFFICIVGDLNGLVATVYLIYKLFTSKSQHRNIFQGKKRGFSSDGKFPEARSLLYFT